MTNISIEYNNKRVTRAMRRLLNSGRDMSPLMRRVAGHLKNSSRQAFDRQQSPSGHVWERLKPSTLKKRQKSGHVPAMILRRSGALSKSILADSDKTSAVVGTIRKYAGTHQFGAKRGQYGSTKRGAPIPWGDIPARPFLGISTEDEADIKHIILDHIARHWRCLR